MPPSSCNHTRRLLLGGLASSLFLTTACTKTSQRQVKTLPANATALCIGDSLTYGQGAGTSPSYPQWLAQLTGLLTHNAGVNGDTTEGTLARLPALLKHHRPDLVLLSIGGNDFLRRLPLDRTRQALTTLVEMASAQTQVILVAEPAPAWLALVTGSLQDHTIYSEVAEATDTPLYAGGWSHVLSRSEWRSDQIHANAQGYKVFAQGLADWLREQKFVA
jgi:acyl-CoA thioesterase-1